jgi:hypothetical protein
MLTHYNFLQTSDFAHQYKQLPLQLNQETIDKLNQMGNEEGWWQAYYARLAQIYGHEYLKENLKFTPP